MRQHNLFVSYRINSDASGEESIVAVIEKLGHAIAVQQSCWYTRTQLGASEAATLIWAAMNPEGSLLVIDATEGEAAWRNMDTRAAEFVKEWWTTPLSSRRVPSS